MNHRKLAFGTMSLMGVSAIKSVVLFLLLPVMAKLVGPVDYGVYSIALPAVMFVMVIADGGLGMSLAREKDDESHVWSSAFYALITAACCLAAMLMFYAWLVAPSAGDRRLLPVTALLASSLIFSALSVIPSARLVRDGEMTKLAAVDILSFAVGASTAVTMAVFGFGVWSLAAQIVIINIVRAALLNLLAPVRPKLVLNLTSLGPHIALGGAVGLARLSDFGGRMGEMFIIERTHTSYTGPFGFGTQVGKFACELVNNQIWALMYIIGLNAEEDALRAYFFRLTRVVAILVLPIAALTTAMAERLIDLTMGPEWALSASLIAVYTPVFAIVCIASIGSSLMYARGVASRPLLLNLELVIFRLIAIAVLPLYGWGPMLAALAAGHVANACHSFWIIHQKYRWRISSLLIWLSKPFFAAVGAGAVVHFLASALPATLSGLTVSGLAGLIIYAALLLAADLRQITGDIRDFYRLLRDRKKDQVPVTE